MNQNEDSYILRDSDIHSFYAPKQWRFEKHRSSSDAEQQTFMHTANVN